MLLVRSLQKIRSIHQRIQRLGGVVVISRHIANMLRQEGWRAVLLRVRRHLIAAGADNGGRLLTGGQTWPLTATAPADFPGSIAVMLHAYYPDLLPEIRAYLANMPQSYVLLVSVVDHDAASEVRRILADLPAVQRLEIKVVENRGRDIAPMLVGFRAELQNFDLICHIHTKKSLYTSSEQIGWRQHNFAHLFPSTPILRQLLGLFAAEPTLGILYPRHSANVPYWAMTWLSNKGIGRELMLQLGADFDSGAYFDFPTGSMFWARRSALQTLFKLELQLSDFPEEQGQIDGCLHHAIERSLVTSARLAGLKSAVIDLANACVRERDDKNLHHYLYAPLAERLNNSLTGIEILSLDIFDTLLLRPFANPDRMFDYLADRFAATEAIKGFVELRKGAEVRARQRLQKDVSLTDIYEELARSGVPVALCKKLETDEQSTEKRMLVPRPAMLQALQRIKPDLPRLLVSDMYLPTSFLREQMDICGVSVETPIWVSNALNRRKDSGSMWQYMREESPLTRGRQILHVGDNEHSDIQLPLDTRTAETCHVMRPANLFMLSLEGTSLAEKLSRKTWSDDLLFGLLARRASNVMDVHPQTFYARSYFAKPEDFGYALLGPLLFHYLSWVNRQAQVSACSDLLYVAREGHLLTCLHQKLAAHAAHLPRAHYFLCSRQATGLPSLNKIDDLRLLGRNKFHGSLAEFISARLDAALLALPALSSLADKKLVLPNDIDILIDIFRKAEPEILAMAADARELYRAYIKQLAPEGSRFAVVDVGYNGSIQANLQRTLGHGLEGFYMMTQPAVAVVESAGGKASACFAEALENTSDYPLFRYSLLLEALLSAPHGQVRRLLPDLSFAYAPQSLDDAMIDCLSATHQGAMQFFDDVLNAFGADWPMIKFDQAQLESLFMSFVSGDLAADELLTTMQVEDYFCGNGILSVAQHYGFSGARV